MTNNPIGIFGGTFDPVHNGHLQIARDTLACVDLQTIYFVPCRVPVHRAQPIASTQQRLDMLNLALADEKNMQVDTRELDREPPSYAIETIRSFRADFPDTPLCFLMGFDAFNDFDTWEGYQEILTLAHLIVIHRPNTELTHTPSLQTLLNKRQTENIEDLKINLAGKIYLQTDSNAYSSATKFRTDKTFNMLPSSLKTYITKNQVYP